MDHIFEFLSPNFHLLQVKAFGFLLLVVVGTLVLGRPRMRTLDLLLLAFASWAALYATRNIPLSAILLTLTISPFLGAVLRGVADRQDVAAVWRNAAASFDGFALWTNAMEERLAGHLWPAAAACFLALSAVGASSLKETLTFSEKQLPVAATEYMAAHNIHDHFFSPDFWGGYIIYRLYPNVRLMMDDRHDFYGAAFVRDYLTMLQVGPGWRNLLDANRVNWVVAPCDSPLANALKAVAGWRVIYEDETAVIFERATPLAQVAASPGAGLGW